MRHVQVMKYVGHGMSTKLNKANNTHNTHTHTHNKQKEGLSKRHTKVMNCRSKLPVAHCMYPSKSYAV